MLKDMLGVAVRKLVTLPSETLGVVCDLLEKLADPTWVTATKKFLRKENPWPPVIVRAITFDPESFLGKGWKIKEQDEFSLALDVVDLSRVRIENCFKDGETELTVRDKFQRLKITNYIRLDNRFLLALLKNPKLIPSNWKKLTNGYATKIFFDGTILRSPSGMAGVLYLYWNGSQWCWNCWWLTDNLNISQYSAVLTRFKPLTPVD